MRRWSTSAAIVIAAVALIPTSCGDPPDDPEPGRAQIRSEVPTVVDSVVVDDDGFDPVEVTITAGEGLELVNEGDAPHGFDGGEDLDTGLLEPGERSTLVLGEAGEYRFVDPAEPDHEGVVVVEPDPDDPESSGGD